MDFDSSLFAAVSQIETEMLMTHEAVAIICLILNTLPELLKMKVIASVFASSSEKDKIQISPNSRETVYKFEP
jgi:hypothetical protein